MKRLPDLPYRVLWIAATTVGIICLILIVFGYRYVNQ